MHPASYEKPMQTMAVVVSKGDPNVVGEAVFPAMYDAVYGLKMMLEKTGKGDFKVTGLRARWPDARLLPEAE